MESVSRVLYGQRGSWDPEIDKFWAQLLAMFTVKINKTCGTHVHFAPWGRRYSLHELHTIAFAVVYYEPYVVSCLPVERRDYQYCKRNTKMAQPLGQLFNSGQLTTVASYIRSQSTPSALINFIQGGLDGSHRYALWNFQNQTKTSGTIEFRGGRHMRGPNRSRAWITFVLVFTTMAIGEVS